MKSTIKKLALFTLTATIVPQAFGLSLEFTGSEAIALVTSVEAAVGGLIVYATCSDIEKNTLADYSKEDSSMSPHALRTLGDLTPLRCVGGILTTLGTISSAALLIKIIKVD